MTLKKILLALICFGSISVFAQDNKRPAGCEEISIPEAIGICGDGAGTTWGIHFPCAPEAFSIGIYNRWGEEIFTSEDYKFQWLPVDKDENQLPAGVYIFTLKYTQNGEEKKISGQVTLIC